MAYVYPATANPYVVTTADHGNVICLGNAGNGEPGAWTVYIVPDEFWDGSFAVLGGNRFAVTDGVGMVPVPYRRININGQASDYSLVGFDPTTALIQSTAIIQIPSSSLYVGLLASIGTGTCKIYYLGVTGTAIP